MFFIYSDTVRSDGDFNSTKFNPTNMYMKHFENYLMLNLELRNAQAEGSFLKIHQATKELDIATKKMEWWSKRPKFEHDAMLVRCVEMKKLWGLTDL